MLKLPGTHLGVQVVTVREIGGFQAQADGRHAGAAHGPGHPVVDAADVQGVGGMKAQVQAGRGDAFEQRQGMGLGIHQEGIVVEGHVTHPETPVPMGDLLENQLRAAPLAHRRQDGGGAVGAAVRASPGGEQRDEGHPALQVQGRQRMGVQVVGVEARIRPVPGELGRHVQHRLFPGPGHHPVGTGMAPGVIGQQGGIDAAQHHRPAGKGVPELGDGLGDPRGPVGHQAGDQDEIRRWHGGQVFPQPGHRNPVAREGARHVGQPRRLGNGGFQERPAALASRRNGGGGAGVEPVQAVVVGHAVAVPAQDGRQQKQAQGAGPEVVGGEIVDPGVDQQNARGWGAHGSGKYCMEVFFSSRWLNSRM